MISMRELVRSVILSFVAAFALSELFAPSDPAEPDQPTATV